MLRMWGSSFRVDGFKFHGARTPPERPVKLGLERFRVGFSVEGLGSGP